MKNQVRFDERRGEGDRGYIVRTTKQFMYVVLEKDLYRVKQDIKFVKSHKSTRSFHFMEEKTEDVKWKLTRFER